MISGLLQNKRHWLVEFELFCAAMRADSFESNTLYASSLTCRMVASPLQHGFHFDVITMEMCVDFAYFSI